MPASDALPVQERRERARCALVLSGGGARGAYEAGVMYFVYGKLARRLGFLPRIDAFCGSSVGAVHSCYLAAHADQPIRGISGLVEIWREMAFSSVYSFGLGDAFNFTRTLIGSMWGTSTESDEHPERLHGLLNTTPLEELVVKRIPWRGLRRNLHRDVVDYLCVSATEIATGRTVAFIDKPGGHVPRWTNDPMHVAQITRLGPEHALASAAIPFMFPAVRIGDTYYCDGSLRQHTPLTPALRMGANRLLIVGLRSDESATPGEHVEEERLAQFRSASFLFGKILNALLIDRLEYDVTHMRVLNQVLKASMESTGVNDLDRLNDYVRHERGIGFQIVQDAFIRPSEDIGRIAARHVARMRAKPANSWAGGLAFRALTRGSPDDEADLMSYLMFDGRYAAELIELGMSDAERDEEKLASLFLD